MTFLSTLLIYLLIGNVLAGWLVRVINRGRLAKMGWRMTLMVVLGWLPVGVVVLLIFLLTKRKQEDG